MDALTAVISQMAQQDPCCGDVLLNEYEGGGNTVKLYQIWDNHWEI